MLSPFGKSLATKIVQSWNESQRNLSALALDRIDDVLTFDSEYLAWAGPHVRSPNMVCLTRSLGKPNLVLEIDPEVAPSLYWFVSSHKPFLAIPDDLAKMLRLQRIPPID